MHHPLRHTRPRLSLVCARTIWVFAFALVCLVPASAAAGPWVKKPGETYLKLAAGTFSSDKVFDLEGELIEPDYAYSHTAVSVYGEVGIYPSVALNFSAPFLASTNELNERTRYKRWGPGDLDLAVQVSLKDGACAASVSPGVRLPLYEGTVGEGAEVNTVTQGSTGVERYTPALGDGSVDLVALGAFGCSLYPFPGWVSVQAGPRFRLQGFGDGVDYAVDGGVFVWPDRLALTARVGGVQRFSGDNDRPTKSYVSAGAGLIANIYAGFALEAGASYIPWGVFVSRGWSTTIGLSYTGALFPNPYD